MVCLKMLLSLTTLRPLVQRSAEKKRQKWQPMLFTYAKKGKESGNVKSLAP